MNWLIVIAGWGLLGQLSGTITLPMDEPEPAAAMIPLMIAPGTPDAAPLRHRLTPPELVAEAAALPPDGQLAGRPVALLAVLSSSPDRKVQRDAARAYWRLVEATADYSTALEHARRIERLESTAGASAEWRAAMAASRAMVREAELAVVAAQYDLAGRLVLPADAPLPLPADLPHAGPYRTEFEVVFAARPAPVPARMLHRTLPIRYRAIDQWAAAVDGAEAAWASADEAYRLGQGELTRVVAAIEQCTRQRREFFRSVRQYNEEIADYVVAVAQPGTQPKALLAMLIQVAAEPVAASEMGGGNGVEPATFMEPVLPPVGRSGVRVPTPADPRTRPLDATATDAEARYREPAEDSMPAQPLEPESQVPTPPDAEWAPSLPVEPLDGPWGF